MDSGGLKYSLNFTTSSPEDDSFLDGFPGNFRHFVKIAILTKVFSGSERFIWHPTLGFVYSFPGPDGLECVRRSTVDYLTEALAESTSSISNSNSPHTRGYEPHVKTQAHDFVYWFSQLMHYGQPAAMTMTKARLILRTAKENDTLVVPTWLTRHENDLKAANGQERIAARAMSVPAARTTMHVPHSVGSLTQPTAGTIEGQMNAFCSNDNHSLKSSMSKMTVSPSQRFSDNILHQSVQNTSASKALNLPSKLSTTNRTRTAENSTRYSNIAVNTGISTVPAQNIQNSCVMNPLGNGSFLQPPLDLSHAESDLLMVSARPRPGCSSANAIHVLDSSPDNTVSSSLGSTSLPTTASSRNLQHTPLAIKAELVDQSTDRTSKLEQSTQPKLACDPQSAWDNAIRNIKCESPVIVQPVRNSIGVVSNQAVAGAGFHSAPNDFQLSNNSGTETVESEQCKDMDGKSVKFSPRVDVYIPRAGYVDSFKPRKSTLGFKGSDKLGKQKYQTNLKPAHEPTAQEFLSSSDFVPLSQAAPKRKRSAYSTSSQLERVDDQNDTLMSNNEQSQIWHEEILNSKDSRALHKHHASKRHKSSTNESHQATGGSPNSQARGNLDTGFTHSAAPGQLDPLAQTSGAMANYGYSAPYNTRMNLPMNEHFRFQGQKSASSQDEENVFAQTHNMSHYVNEAVQKSRGSTDIYALNTHEGRQSKRRRSNILGIDDKGDDLSSDQNLFVSPYSNGSDFAVSLSPSLSEFELEPTERLPLMSGALPSSEPPRDPSEIDAVVFPKRPISHTYVNHASTLLPRDNHPQPKTDGSHKIMPDSLIGPETVHHQVHVPKVKANLPLLSRRSDTSLTESITNDNSGTTPAANPNNDDGSTPKKLSKGQRRRLRKNLRNVQQPNNVNTLHQNQNQNKADKKKVKGKKQNQTGMKK